MDVMRITFTAQCTFNIRCIFNRMVMLNVLFGQYFILSMHQSAYNEKQYIGKPSYWQNISWRLCLCILNAACDGQGDELSLKYKRVPIEDAEQGWNEVFEASLDSCMHGMYCQQGADCQV